MAKVVADSSDSFIQYVIGGEQGGGFLKESEIIIEADFMKVILIYEASLLP
jgi:hypothetical protein